MSPTIEVLETPEERMTTRYSDRKKTACKVTLSSGNRVGEGLVLDVTVPGVKLRPGFPWNQVRTSSCECFLIRNAPLCALTSASCAGPTTGRRG